MKLLQFSHVNYIFHGACLLATIGYGINSVYDFVQNHDLTTITFKTFHNDDESIYPSLSMCFNAPFLKENLIQSANLSRTIEYSRYLIGKAPTNETLDNINFEDVSFQINDFLIKAVIQFKYGGRLSKRRIQHDEIHIQSWGRIYRITKCFTFDVPYLEKALAKSMSIYFNTSVYPNSQRPADGGNPGGLQLFAHYPQQFGRSL